MSNGEFHDAIRAAMQAEDLRSEVEGARHNGHAGDVRFNFTQFRNIQLDRAPPYRVHELLPRIGVVIVWGKPKSGKTFWTFDLEMHVALGRPYRGRRVEQGEVLHIACEGARGLGARKEAWRLYHTEGKSDEEIATIEAAPFYLCKDTALDLTKDVDKVMTDIAIQFADRSIAVITIDTLNRSLKGSESKDDDMGRYLSAAIALADKFQCCVLIVHHCGYNEDRPRGHSSLLGSADAIIETKKDDGGHLTTEVEEMRDGPAGAQTHSRLAVVTVAYDDNDTPITSCVVVGDEAPTQNATHKRTPLPPPAKVALQQLRKVLAKAGEAAPASDHIPPNISVVNFDLWRRYCYQAGISDGDSADARKKAFQRASDKLQAEEFIGRWGEWIWLR